MYVQLTSTKASVSSEARSITGKCLPATTLTFNFPGMIITKRTKYKPTGAAHLFHNILTHNSMIIQSTNPSCKIILQSSKQKQFFNKFIYTYILFQTLYNNLWKSST